MKEWNHLYLVRREVLKSNQNEKAWIGCSPEDVWIYLINQEENVLWDFDKDIEAYKARGKQKN